MIRKKNNRPAMEVNAGSMADIAFLLLIFFLVTTTINADKGIPMLLPPDIPPTDVEIKKHNVFNVLVNSKNQLLVEEEPCSLDDLGQKVKKFITNNGEDPNLSDSPEVAVVSIKTDRGTSYNVYIKILDEVRLAYNELRSEFLGISAEEFLTLDLKDPANVEKRKEAQKAVPYRVSEAEPTDVSAFK